jgi:hypothetical protein
LRSIGRYQGKALRSVAVILPFDVALKEKKFVLRNLGSVI